MAEISFGIIIPTYRRTQKLERCLENISRQTILPNTVYIVNDSDTVIEKESFSNYSKFGIKIIQTNNIGPALARNKALSVFAEDIVGFLDDDSYADDKWVESCLNAFEKFQVQAQLGDIKLFNGENNNSFLSNFRQKIFESRRIKYTSKTAIQATLEAAQKKLGDMPGTALHISGSNCAFRMGFLRQIGFFDPNYITYHDKELAWRILFNGEIILFNPDMIVEHEHHPSIRRWISRTVFASKFELLLKKQYKKVYWKSKKMHSLLMKDFKLRLQADLTLKEKLFLLLLNITSFISKQRLITLKANPISNKKIVN